MNKVILKDSDIKDAANAVFDKYVEAINEEFGGPSDSTKDYINRTNEIIKQAELKNIKKITPAKKIILRKVAVILLVACLGTSSTLVFSEEARAMIQNWYKSTFENKIVYYHTDSDKRDNEESVGEKIDIKMGFPVFGWIPEGFDLLYDLTIDNEDWCEVTYRDKYDNYVSFDCYKNGTINRMDLNADGSNAETVYIRGMKGDYYDTIYLSDASILVWADDDTESLCILGSNLDKDSMVKIAEGIKYDSNHKLTAAGEDSSINIYTNNKGAIEQDALDKYEHVLDITTKKIFESYKSFDNEIKGFELESFYKSFEFENGYDMNIEVYDFYYRMIAGEDVMMAGGMHRDKDGFIRNFTGGQGQIAVMKRSGELIKVVPITGMDVLIDPADANDEMIKWIKEMVMVSLKNPRYVNKEFLFN